MEEMGYKIAKKNFRCRRGEVDIIAIDENILAFVEVKAWNRYGLSDLEYSINWNKRRRIIATAREFLHCYPTYRTYQVRFDLLFVPYLDEALIYHLPNAFEEE